MSKNFKSPNSTVERFRNSRGQDVPIDTFLYACFEAENTMRAIAKDKPRQIQWPTLQDLSPEDLDDEISHHALQDLFEDMMSWYAANFPDLSSPLAWDYGVLAQVVPPLVSLAQDLGVIHLKKNGIDIPFFDVEADVQNSVWNQIRGLIDRLFSTKSNYIMRYLEWSFSKEKAEDPDAGSRPPVGRHSPNFRPRSGGGGNFQGGGNRDRGQRGNNRGGGGRDGGGRNNRGGRDRDQRGGGNYDNNRGRSQNRNKRNIESNPELETAALEECKQAISHLENSPSEESVILKPQNSYYRRIQHQMIVESGYHSESTGDGHERSVVVWRKST